MALSVQGSTLMTVAARVIEAYARRGGRSCAVLSDNRDVSLPATRVAYVDYTRRCRREFFTRRELAIDIAGGRLTGRRPYYGRLYEPAIDAIGQLRPDIALLYEGHYASASLPQWRRVRRHTQVCLYVHNPLSRTYGRTELARLLRGADRVVFCADHLRADVVRRLGGRADSRFEVVHNGVNPVFFVDRPEPTDRFVVVFAGRLARHKGVHVMLDAVRLAAQRIGRPVDVRIAGSAGYGADGSMDEYERQLRTQAERLGLSVEFLGWTGPQQLADEFSRASAVCLPSLWDEGFPLVALEAMAAGAPVLCSESAGLREAAAGVGLFSAFGGTQAMADQLVALADDPREWQRRSSAGVARAHRYTWSDTASALAGIGPVAGAER